MWVQWSIECSPFERTLFWNNDSCTLNHLKSQAIDSEEHLQKLVEVSGVADAVVEGVDERSTRISFCILVADEPLGSSFLDISVTFPFYHF